ncbi:hypothetical protein ACFU9B_43430 [Streptomyces sp. NPDC057592]|uniref:hypothetical protein n=1 Tax=unclassified Streptomyces TaxID=2593676 RepID=UPI00369B11D3
MSPRRRSRANEFASEEQPSAPTVPRAMRTDPVRVTLDLAPAEHRELKQWCNIAAADLDLSQVPLTAVLRILGQQLRTDEELATTVRAELAQGGGGIY